MLRFDPRHEHISPKPTFDLLWIGPLKEQLNCLSQVGSRLCNAGLMTRVESHGTETRTARRTGPWSTVVEVVRWGAGLLAPARAPVELFK
jgi:hypothetical protein